MRTRIIPMFVLFLLCAWSVQAESVFVENFSFEDDVVGIQIKGWENITGWSSDTVAIDSGVEETTATTDGSWRGFLMGSDPNVWQITGETIAAGRTYTLKGDLWDTWTAATMTISMFYVNDVNDINGFYQEKVELALEEVAVGGLNETTAVRGTVTYVVDDGPANAIGKKLGIMFDNNAGGWTGFDNISLDIDWVSLVAPSPSGVENIEVDTNLAWTNNHNWNMDVYLSSPYNDPNPAPILTQVIGNQAAVTSYDPPADLEYRRWYYWRVDAREPNMVGTMQDIIHQSPLWSFKTVPEEPVVTFNNVITTMDILPATMSATILNPGTGVTFTLLDDDFEYPAGATVTLTPDVSDLSAPTVTVDADTSGIYKIKLVVSSSVGDVESIAEVVVHADACEAKKEAPSGSDWNANYYDRDEDCDVDLDDFADLVTEWLGDTGLAAQVIYQGEVQYIPIDLIVALTNPSFEQPDEGKIWNDWGRIPGWSSDANPSDSGVEENGAATNGSYIGFLMDTDSSVWQTSGHTIVGDEVFELSFDAQNTSAFEASLYYVDGGGARVPLTTQIFVLTGSMTSQFLTFDVSTVPAAAGNLLGVEFDNAGSGWCQFDSVALTK